MIRLLPVFLGITLAFTGFAWCKEPNGTASESPTVSPPSFQAILKKNRDLLTSEFLKSIPRKPLVERIDFDPTKAAYYEKISRKIRLFPQEEKIYRNQGFVIVDGRTASANTLSGDGFGRLYYSIYSADLPVFVSVDSILHAMHRSYEEILVEIESVFLREALQRTLVGCHAELGRRIQNGIPEEQKKHYGDIDLYLTVALNLLAGAGAPAVEKNPRPQLDDLWEGRLFATPKMTEESKVLDILTRIQSLKMENPLAEEFTPLFGGKRAIDYSQFRPRSHYARNANLSRYFRAMLWLGRADTGFNVLPPDPISLISSDSRRELADAVLLTDILKSSGYRKQFEEMNGILEFMIGSSDSSTPAELFTVLDEAKIHAYDEIFTEEKLGALEKAVREKSRAKQQICSQIVVSSLTNSHQVDPPAIFQFFGQRYIIDSFLLSEVVFDQILFKEQKMQRRMPCGLDVAYALGNDEAAFLLESELERYRYAANLKSCREFVDTRPDAFWKSNLYSAWLDSLRGLSETPEKGRFPQAMRTPAWRRKQLQTQLASWSELRHDTILYAKQSYSRMEECEYPAAYVEPYPAVYAKIKFFCEEAARRIRGADYTLGDDTSLSIYRQNQITFLSNMAEIVGRLEKLSRKELDGEPFSDSDRDWLKRTINIHRADSGTTSFSGWYCLLFYPAPTEAENWKNIITDVHTSPTDGRVLEAGTGPCDLLLIAVDNGDDRAVYVGPVYSYYEFSQPVGDRLTDEQWDRELRSDCPARPEWTKPLRGDKQKR